MEEFCIDVEVTEKRRLRVQFRADALPSNEEMKEILDNELYDDIIDDETIEILSVDSVGDDDDAEA